MVGWPELKGAMCVNIFYSESISTFRVNTRVLWSFATVLNILYIPSAVLLSLSWNPSGFICFDVIISTHLFTYVPPAYIHRSTSFTTLALHFIPSFHPCPTSTYTLTRKSNPTTISLVHDQDIRTSSSHPRVNTTLVNCMRSFELRSHRYLQQRKCVECLEIHSPHR